jgi:uncharacterized delta-60 repeat protein
MTHSFVRSLCSALAMVLVGAVVLYPLPAFGTSSSASGPSRNQESAEAAGDLDTTFGNGGIKLTDFSGNYDAATALAFQPDGKIVVAGAAYEGGGVATSDFGLIRYNSDGSLDPGFGIAGKLTTDFFGNFDQPNAVAIQLDGKIIAAGSAGQNISTADFAVVRYNASGSLDQGFGSGGKLVTDFFQNQDVATSIAVQADGKIVLAGWAEQGTTVSTADFALARYNLDGSLDQSFGSGGKVTTDFFGSVDLAYGIALQPDGKLVAVGSVFNHGAVDFGLARYNPDGSLDQTFGTGGKLTTDFAGKSDSAYCVALQRDGKIVAAGYASHGNTAADIDFALARYNPDGSLDQAFGASGKRTVDFFGDADVVDGLAIQSDAKIVLAGYASHSSSASEFALARYNADGTLDQTFGTGGLRTTNLQGNSDDDDIGRAVAIQADGSIVVAGNTERGLTSSTADFALVRYSSGASADFTIGFDAPSVSASAGSKARVTVLINRTGGFSGNVIITPPAANAGIKPKPPDPVTTTSGSANFKLKIGGGVSPGSYTRTFTAIDDLGRTRTATLTIVVQ